MPVKAKSIVILIATLTVLLLAVFVFLSLALKAKTSGSDSQPEPTTARLKSIDDGPVYLRLEQIRPEVITRVLLTCMEGRMYMNGGIVTTPDLSSSMLGKATENYLEIDADEILRAKGTDGAQVAESTIWIFRPLDEKQTVALKTASLLGAWTEDGGNFRWGAYMNVENVRGEIAQYVERCK